MRKFTTFFLFVSLAIIFSSSALFAQDKFPEFLLTPDQDIPEPTLSKEDNVEINLTRPLMRDVIYLQEQINLLEGLVERQSGIQKIATNYQRAGIPYKQPPPPRSVCEKLPTNILCLFFYPDMQGNGMFIDDLSSSLKQKKEQAFMSSIEDYSLEDESAMEDLSYQEPAQTYAQYAWSDIECKAEKCSALIVATNNENNRFRVNSGDNINSSFKILSITPGKVKVELNNQETFLSPVATNGEIIQQSLVNEIISTSMPSESMPENKSLNPPVEEEETETTEAPSQLGPTGLF